ncbi:MAG: NusG domain II-containing protein [Treponema sp.]|nr:NusG domain II-containing protein [Treponema sp.]
MKSWVKIFDIIIILIVAGITFFAAYTAYMKPANESFVVIQGQNREWIFPINTSETIAVSGPLGDTIVRLNEHKAWIESSPCANKTCVAYGAVTNDGQWSACLPNNVFLVITGAKKTDEEIDAVTR